MESSRRNVPAIVGLVMSVVAVVPVVWFAIYLTTLPSSTFTEDYGLNSIAYGLFIFFVLIPFELVVGVPAAILSGLGIMRARNEQCCCFGVAVAGAVLTGTAWVLSISSIWLVG